MPRLAIVGPGAVGSVIAAHLHLGGRHEIILCSRRPLPEIRVQTTDAEVSFAPLVLTDPAQSVAVDWALVTTKAYDAAVAAAWINAMCSHGAPAAILQNGVEHRERFAGLVAGADLVPVVVDCPAERSSAGEARQRGPARLTVSDDLRGRAFAALFEDTTVHVNTTNDFVTAAWRKLCLNAPGVISALLRQPSRVMRDEGIADLARAMVRECLHVGRAEGAVLPDDLPDAIVENYRAAPGDSVNSLHADVLAGRPTEVDARNGAIVRFGRKHRIATPRNEMAVALLNAVRELSDAPPLQRAFV
jgi:2-dehydropantoate 2-reductase